MRLKPLRAAEVSDDEEVDETHEVDRTRGSDEEEEVARSDTWPSNDGYLGVEETKQLLVALWLPANPQTTRRLRHIQHADLLR